jgi:hypothetical protein
MRVSKPTTVANFPHSICCIVAKNCGLTVSIKLYKAVEVDRRVKRAYLHQAYLGDGCCGDDTHGAWSLAKREPFHVGLGGIGESNLDIPLVSITSGRCLLRIRGRRIDGTDRLVIFGS